MLRPEDRAARLHSALIVAACSANADEALRAALDYQDAYDSHVLRLAPAPSGAPSRAFPARYRGRCAICDGQIEIDDMIVRAVSPRTGVDHQGCADQESGARKYSPVGDR